MTTQSPGGDNPAVKVGCAVVLGILLIVGGCSAIVSASNSGGSQSQTTAAPTAAPSTTQGPPATGGTSTGTAAPQVPLYEGTNLRITGGMRFADGEAEPLDPAFGTVAFLNRKRATGPGRFATSGPSRPAAPWTSSAKPSYQECVNALTTNRYSDDERKDLPKKPGAGICVRHEEDVVVFLRVISYETDTAIRVDATVWKYIS